MKKVCSFFLALFLVLTVATPGFAAEADPETALPSVTDAETAKPKPPKTPEEAEQPEEPEQPGETETPEDAGEPEEPELPENTEEPENTEAPEDIEQPEKSETPENAEEPEEPEQPEQAEAPEEAEQPEQAEAPEDTEQPEQDEQPEETEPPEQAENPEAPENPEDLEKIEDPTQLEDTELEKEAPVIHVIVTPCGQIVINPYGLPVETEFGTSREQIVADEMTIFNESEVPIKVFASTTGRISDNSTAIYVTQPPEPYSAEKEIFLYAEFQSAEDPDWRYVYLEADNQILITEQTTAPQQVLLLEAGPSSGLFRMFGATSTSPDDPWSEDDAVDIVISFTFEPVLEEEPLEEVVLEE